jgi:hypothetical protein
MDDREFLPLVLNSLKAQGVNQSTHWVDQFRNCLSASRSMDRGRLFSVRDDSGRLLGGAWLVWDQYRSYYILAGMDRELSSRAAMPTLIWNMMRFTREDLGLRYFDFEGADVPQMEGFARAFGGILVPYFVAIWVTPSLRPFWLMRRFFS